MINVAHLLACKNNKINPKMVGEALLTFYSGTENWKRKPKEVTIKNSEKQSELVTSRRINRDTFRWGYNTHPLYPALKFNCNLWKISFLKNLMNFKMC